MSTQPWLHLVREYEWCACGDRVVNEGDTECTLCAAHRRLADLEMAAQMTEWAETSIAVSRDLWVDDNEDTRDCG